MFPIFRATELAHHLGTSVAELNRVLQSPRAYYEELLLLDPRKPDKERPVLSVKAPLRKWQSRFYRDVLLKSLKPSDFSHGGTRGRSIKTNAEKHIGSQFVYKTDISNFYPGIHDTRVYRLFVDRFGCPPSIADLCCRLCTHKHHLALGLSTSPILADQLLHDVDARIGAACDSAKLVYTRFVDDVTISGAYDMNDAGIPTLIGRILRQHGFKAKSSKSEADSNGDVAITGVRIIDGHLDVAKEYALELDRQLDDAISLAHDESFDGPYYTYGQLVGRVRFVCWINPRRGKAVKSKLRRIGARRLAQHAMERQFVRTKKRLIRQST
jgi:hypothetical protein